MEEKVLLKTDEEILTDLGFKRINYSNKFSFRLDKEDISFFLDRTLRDITIQRNSKYLSLPIKNIIHLEHIVKAILFTYD